MNYQDLNKFTVPSDFRGRSKITVQIWWIVEKTLFAWSPQVFYGWRRFLLRSFGAEIGKKVLIRSTARFTYPWKVKIGDYSWIGEDCTLYSLGDIVIGNHVAVAHGVYFNTGYHDYKLLSFKIASKPIVVGDQCWLTNDVYIAPGVTIGNGTVVGARSTVLKDLPENKVCFGSPAIAIKDRL